MTRRTHLSKHPDHILTPEVVNQQAIDLKPWREEKWSWTLTNQTLKHTDPENKSNTKHPEQNNLNIDPDHWLHENK